MSAGGNQWVSFMGFIVESMSVKIIITHMTHVVCLRVFSQLYGVLVPFIHTTFLLCHSDNVSHDDDDGGGESSLTKSRETRVIRRYYIHTRRALETFKNDKTYER